MKWNGVNAVITTIHTLHSVMPCAPSNSHYKSRFFESPPTAGFQKTDFGVSSAEGAGNTKVGFIMRIASALRAGQPKSS